MDLKTRGIFSSGTNKRDDLLETESKWEMLSPVSLIILCTMSILFIRSAQAYTGGNQWQMQVIWVIIGFSIYVIVSVVDYHFWMRFAHIIYAIGSCFSGTCRFYWPEKYGAQRWIDLGLFKIQPSEFAKIVTLILGASIMARSEIGNLRDSFKGICKLGFCFALSNVLDFQAT